MTVSIGFQVAVCAVPFFDMLDEEEASLSAEVAGAHDAAAASAAMEQSRQRIAQAVDRVVRSLPAPVRGDLTASRAVAYALVGLVDGRMLHRPAGGLEQWRERLLESELYGSALAGQEVVAQAQAAARGIAEGTPTVSHPSTLAPFYLALFRAGFEGSLHGDVVGLSSLTAALEEAVGAGRDRRLEVAPDLRPARVGVAPLPMATIGLAAWLVAGFAVWFALFGNSFDEADQMSNRIAARLPMTSVEDPLDHPSGMATFERGED